jgi:separase
MERRSGLFVTKLEKMAESYQQLQDFQNSYDCMREVIGEHIRNGTVDSVSDLASSCSLDTLWNSDESALSLSKTLDSIHSIIWRGRLLGLPNLDFYDDTELETEKRALLLERQLHLTCSEILKPQQASDAQFSGLDELFGCLFEIYDPEKYPIRRQRVALAASRLMNECPELLSEATVQAVKQSISVKQGQITNDSRLGGFSKHLTASISVNLALQERPVDVNRVEQALRTWTSLSDQPGQSLQDCVEDIPGLIRQLNLIIDYFDLQGLDHLQIPTLSLLGRILELQNPSNTTSIVENMSRLSLQYLRAGYSGKSGITLEKTQELVDSGSVSTEAMVNFYLAYSEHYLSIGALSKW